MAINDPLVTPQQSTRIIQPQTRLITPATETPQQISWQEFQNSFKWNQGEHLTLLGPTGYGKSTLTIKLLHLRAYVVVFATKRKDSTMDKLEAQGYTIQKKFNPEISNRIILKPPLDPDNEDKQRAEFDRTMSEIFYSGGWCVTWDEAVALAHHLRLERKMSLLWQQARSLGISIVAGTQRPAHLPLYAYDQATHYFFWKMKLDKDVERVARLGGLDISGMNRTIRQLQKYQVLYYNKDTDESVTFTPEV